VPEAFPAPNLERTPMTPDVADTAAAVLAPFFAGDPLAAELPAICAEALDFSLPLTQAPGFHVLELFHGPTAAFKDVGARFLAGCLARLGGERTVLVATSGDTGGAVAAAFDGRPGFRVVLLYPKGRVSDRQEAQLTAWGANVMSLRVDGDFDDCQRMVKAAFADAGLRARAGLTSANSISVGRLLPQMAYYAWASLTLWKETGTQPGFIIPSGNLGNSLACLWARRCGLPVGAGCARHQRQRGGGAFLRRRALAAPAHRADARDRHGRRQPEQHGAAAWISPAPRRRRAARRTRSW
jgi:threonine synthase